MLAPTSYDYAVIRVLPRVERGEFINVGVIVYCRTRRYLAARIELDPLRLQALAPDVDVETLQAHLALIPEMCAGEGPVGRLGQADSFHWLVAPHSTVIQASPVHTGLCDDPEAVLDNLMERLVRTPGSSTAKTSG